MRRRSRGGGEQSQALGRSRGGRTIKIHALTDRFCRSLAFLLTGGRLPNSKVGALLVERLPVCRVALADKSYDSHAIRQQIEVAGPAPNIPPRVNRRWKPCVSPVPNRGRNVIGRLKDFRRIATRYDRLARNNLPAVCLEASA